MLTLTPTACGRLSAMLANYPDHVAARIFLRNGQIKLRPSIQQPGDEVFEHQGRAVLLLDEEMAEHVEGNLLDVRNTAEGPRLRFRKVMGKSRP